MTLLTNNVYILCLFADYAMREWLLGLTKSTTLNSTILDLIYWLRKSLDLTTSGFSIPAHNDNGSTVQIVNKILSHIYKLGLEQLAVLRGEMNLIELAISWSQIDWDTIKKISIINTFVSIRTKQLPWGSCLDIAVTLAA